jgi:ABC-type nickel/cobalt efflux system permease component RcnA
MNKTFVRIVFGLLLVSYVLSHFLARAHASSLGIGTNEAVLPSTGYFSGLINWINVHQQNFYRAITGALKSMRDGGGGIWALVGLSFAYGIFHAAGPGHGKAVISSYMLANEVALRRGVMLSFVSAFLQAITAIVVMIAVFLLLRGTAVSMTNATWFLEVASYALIALFGAWLLWKKAWPRAAGLLGRNPTVSLSAAQAHHHDHGHHAHAHHHGDDNHDHHEHAHGDCGHAHHHHAGHDHGHHDHVHAHGAHAEAARSKITLKTLFGAHDHAHHHHDGEVCETCGHSHAPDPKLLSGDRFDWRTAWSAVAAVGLRPCSGALIVLTFAFLNGLWAGGVLSVFAMALGTGITVAMLATIAVTAKNWAVAFAGDGRMGNRVHATIEIAGAAMVFLLGLLLLTASLSA